MKNKNAPSNDAFYWVTILSACTMGETAADFLSHGPLGLGYGWASIILGSLVVVSLALERFAKVANEGRYWTTIVVMATAGTTMADFISRTLKFGYLWGSIFLAALFAATFLLWRDKSSMGESEKANHSVLPHVDINPTGKRLPPTNARYWAAIMVASTLGTTLGDSLSNGTRIGFGGSSLILGLLLAITLFMEYKAHVRNEARYWTALILASTIGATTGDYLTKEEGLNLGYYWGNGALIVVFVGIVLYARGRTLKRRGIKTSSDSLLPNVDL